MDLPHSLELWFVRILYDPRFSAEFVLNDLWCSKIGTPRFFMIVRKDSLRSLHIKILIKIVVVVMYICIYYYYVLRSPVF